MEQFCEASSDNTGYVLAYADGVYTVTDSVGSVVCEFIPDMPTVDAVSVVRCGECRYFGKHAVWGNWCNQIMNRPMEADGFCSRGERLSPPPAE